MMDHPCIVNIKELLDDSESEKIFIVLEYVAGGEVIWEGDSRPSPKDSLMIFRQLIRGVDYCIFDSIF